jgi:predicted regulator of Ras-like GTPase activity (Roadblock/LC7/MglB family)
MTNSPGSWAALLHDLRRINPDVEAAVLLGADGALLSMTAEAGIADALAPALTLLNSVAARTATELGRGALETIVAVGSQGLVVGQELGDGRLLAVLAGATGALGLLLDDVRACAERCRTTDDFGDSALEGA